MKEQPVPLLGLFKRVDLKMSSLNSKESLRSIVISYDEYQRLKNIESRFEELQKKNLDDINTSK